MTRSSSEQPSINLDRQVDIDPETVLAIGLFFLLGSREDAGLGGRIRHVELQSADAGWPWTGEVP